MIGSLVLAAVIGLGGLGSQPVASTPRTGIARLCHAHHGAAVIAHPVLLRICGRRHGR